MPNNTSRTNYGLVISTFNRPKDKKLEEGYTLCSSFTGFSRLITPADKKACNEQYQARLNRRRIANLFETNGLRAIELKNPTRDEFDAQIQFIKEHSNADSVSYIYINCHGYAGGLAMFGSGDGTERVSYRTLREMLDEIPGKKVLFLDTCHSGSSIADLEDVLPVNAAYFNVSKSDVSSEKYEGAFRALDYYVLTSSSINEVSWYTDDEGSYFSRNLCAAVGNRDKRPAGKANSKYVSLKEICKYTSDHKAKKDGKEHVQIDYCYPPDSDFPVFGADQLICGEDDYFLVEVKVADVNGSGTDSDVRVRLFGENRTSGELQLDHPDIDDLERNKTYRYLFRVKMPDSELQKPFDMRKHLGDIKAVEVISDCAGKEHDLLIQSILVKDTAREVGFMAYPTGSDWINSKCSSRRFPAQQVAGQKYKITITVGTDSYAGTDAGIFVQLRGTNGEDVYHLLDSEIDDFEKGSSNIYNVVTEKEIGRLTAINVRSDNTGKDAEVKIVKIVVKDENGTVYSSTENQWLSASQREYLFRLNAGTTTLYSVDIYVPDVKYAGTDAAVKIQLRGRNNQTGQILLDVPGKDDFEQNTHNLYTISGENLGELTSVVLSHNSSGKDPGLCVDTVKITDQSTGEEYWANCREISGGWIEKEKKLSVEYPLKKK